MTTITLEIPDDLAQELQKFDMARLSELLRQLLSLYRTDELFVQDTTAYLLKSNAINHEGDIPSNRESIKTLGDLLEHGYGLWANRDDIDTPFEYATQLRQEGSPAQVVMVERGVKR